VKKIFLTISIVASTVFAGGLEITPFGGFQWNGSNDFEWYEVTDTHTDMKTGSLDIEHFGNYGIFINKDLSAGTQLELSWTGSKTTAKWWSNSTHTGIPKSGTYDVMSNYWLIGGVKYLAPAQSRLLPFVNAGVGVMSFIFDDTSMDTQTFFGVSVGLGAKVMFSNRIGLRFGSRFLIPVNFQGVGMSFGTGGVSAGAYGHVPVLQGDIHGGLIIKLGGYRG
jgi:hypothetical protein